METNGLVGYWTLKPGQPPANLAAGGLYNYAFASNGVFVEARRPGLEICAQLAPCEIRGLLPVEEKFTLAYPRVPDFYLDAMLDLSVSACIQKGKHVEALFHLIWNEPENRWRLDQPEQIATSGSVRPTQDGEGSSYQLALIEVHSHHSMGAFFSSADDADEQGFRIYGVLGNIFSEPKIRVRVGCFGHFWELPAEIFFDMPKSIQDARLSDD